MLYCHSITTHVALDLGKAQENGYFLRHLVSREINLGLKKKKPRTTYR